MAGAKDSKSYIIAQTEIVRPGLQAMLADLGVPTWRTDAFSGAEELVEVGGKLCYLSFDTSLNDNLTRVGTRDNLQYIGDQILRTRHGSVTEHAYVSVAVLHCSRILTHELVRHRAGTAFSQVSGRFVRTDKLEYYKPLVFERLESLVDFLEPGTSQNLLQMMEEEWVRQEDFQKKLVEATRINEMNKPHWFSIKKMLTSAFRRFIGNGQLNHILVTANHRAWRHIFAMRSDFGAEEEIRLWAWQLWEQFKIAYPALYADSRLEWGGPESLGIPAIRFDNWKV